MRGPFALSPLSSRSRSCGATIVVVAGERMVEMPYDEFEHVRVMRDFLAAPERYLRHL